MHHTEGVSESAATVLEVFVVSVFFVLLSVVFPPRFFTIVGSLEDLNEDAQQNFQPKLLTFVLKTLVKAPDLEAATSLVPSPLKAKLEAWSPAGPEV